MNAVNRRIKPKLPSPMAAAEVQPFDFSPRDRRSLVSAIPHNVNKDALIEDLRRMVENRRQAHLTWAAHSAPAAAVRATLDAMQEHAHALAKLITDRDEETTRALLRAVVKKAPDQDGLRSEHVKLMIAAGSQEAEHELLRSWAQHSNEAGLAALREIDALPGALTKVQILCGSALAQMPDKLPAARNDGLVGEIAAITERHGIKASHSDAFITIVTAVFEVCGLSNVSVLSTIRRHVAQARKASKK
jgi:hypothetical protein